MADTTLWEGVAIAMQSALGTAKTISGITKASPGVVSSTSHGISDGAYVKLDVLGMHQVDERIFRVDNGGASDFELEGEDTTLYDTFTSGSAYEITFGTSLSTFTNVAVSGGDFNFIDDTTIHKLVKSQIPGQANALTYTFDSLWDPADAGLIALKAASNVKAKRAFRITFSNGKIALFNGYVGATLAPQGSTGEIVKTNVVITAEGTPTMYAS